VSQPCPRCLSLAFNGKIRVETVMPLPELAPPLSVEDLGEHSPAGSPICHDCQAAENLAKIGVLAAWVATEPGGHKHPVENPAGLDFAARRIVIGNERQEQLRLPAGMRPHFGLVRQGLVRMTEDPPGSEGGLAALEAHHDWLESVGIFVGMRDPLGRPFKDGDDL